MTKPSKPTSAPEFPTAVVEDQNFRKGNAEIGFRIKKGRMTFLSRKVLNSLTYRAQMLGVEGKGLTRKFGKIVIPDDLRHENYWWLDLGEIVKDASFHSKDYALIKEYLADLQRVLVIRDFPGAYESDQLLGSVRIINTLGPGTRRGGKLLLGWRFPEETEDKVLRPDIYTRLSVYFQGLLRTEQALVLYEICKRYSTSPANLTARKHWHLWYEQLSGNEVGAKKPEFKYFKRNLLSPAILEVNTVTDIQVELIEYKNGRWVEDLQFVTKPKAQQQLILPEEPAIDGALLDRLESIGIKDAEKICATHPNDFVKATLDIVEERMRNPKLTPLESPAAFFRVALRDEYAKSAKPKRIAAPKPAPREEESEESKAAAAERQRIREAYEALSGDEKQKVLAAFTEDANPFARKEYEKSGLRSRIAKAEFERLLPELLARGVR